VKNWTTFLKTEEKRFIMATFGIDLSTSRRPKSVKYVGMELYVLKGSVRESDRRPDSRTVLWRRPVAIRNYLCRHTNALGEDKTLTH
jgi:hypothetical protein